VRANGEVVVESHLIGHLHAFRFIPDREAIGAEYKAVMNATRKALQSEIKRRLTMILNAKPEQITLDATGQLLWQQKVGSPLPGEPVARLKKGGSPLKPDIELIDTDLLAGVEKEALQSFLTQWLHAHLGTVLEPLIGLEQTDDLPASVRGICFQVYESMGIIPREKLEELIATLSTEDRAALRSKKIKLGPILVFLPALNKPAAVRLRALLWALYQGRPLPVDVPKDGIVSVKVDLEAIDKDFYQSIGYPVYGGRAIRIDMLDRVISAVYDSAQGGKFQAQHKMAEWLGCPIDDLYAVLESMGHKKIYDPLSEKTEADAKTEVKPEEKPKEKAEEKSEEPVVEPMAVVAPEATVAAVEVSETLVAVAQDQAPQDQAPQDQIKPELATFRLKKGKAFESAKPYTPRHEGQENRKPFQGKKSAPHNAPYKSGDKPHNKSQDSSGGRGQESGQGKDFKKPDKSKRRANPKGKDYKQSNMVAEAKVKDDSPFAILEQLKKNADGKG
jgi:ATP-dependent RNA helicase SUPV3L1/SUV3